MRNVLLPIFLFLIAYWVYAESPHTVVVNTGVDPSSEPLGIEKSRSDFLIHWNSDRDGGLLASSDLSHWTTVASKKGNLVENVVSGRGRFQFRERDLTDRRFYQFVGGTPSLIQVPSTYDGSTPMPLLISLHQYNSTLEKIEEWFPFESWVEELGFFYCKPRGDGSNPRDVHWDGTDACCHGETAEHPDHVQFLKDIITATKEALNVDPERVYIFGGSNGGYMAYQFACRESELVAAIGSYAGATWADPSRCAPSTPVDLLHIHGTEDNVTLYEGGESFLNSALYPGAEDSVKIWAGYHGVEEPVFEWEEEVFRLVGTPEPEARVGRIRGAFINEQEIDLELWRAEGGGHAPYPDEEMALQRAELVARWLLDHRKRPGTLSVSE